VSASAEEWAAARSVVADRLVSGYAGGDWLLAILHRAASNATGGSAGRRRGRPVAGLRPVAARGVEDVALPSLLLGRCAPR
jgi:hypothetical protein